MWHNPNYNLVIQLLKNQLNPLPWKVFGDIKFNKIPMNAIKASDVTNKRLLEPKKVEHTSKGILMKKKA